MKNLLGLFVFLAGTSLAIADTPVNVQTKPRATSSQPAPRDAANTPQGKREESISLIEPTEALTVTGTRPRSIDIKSELASVPSRSTAPRELSAPVAIDVVSEPVLLTLGTGNTHELRHTRVAFPFESVQDRTVKDSDVLQFRLASFNF